MKPLTESMKTALKHMLEDGYAVAGTNSRKGRLFRIQASTLLALEARGLIETFLGPDSGMAARFAKAPGEDSYLEEKMRDFPKGGGMLGDTARALADEGLRMQVRREYITDLISAQNSQHKDA